MRIVCFYGWVYRIIQGRDTKTVRVKIERMHQEYTGK